MTDGADNAGNGADPIAPADTAAEQKGGISGLLGGVNGRIATIGAIITAIVGINSSLSSCSADTANRYAAFRTAVSTEEGFWKDRFSEYSEIMDTQDADDRKRKLWALAAMAGHDVPDFAEYRLGLFDDRGAIQAARKRLQGMRDTLNGALTSEITADPKVADAVQKSLEFDGQQDKLAETPASPDVPPPADPIATISGNKPDYRTLTLSNGTAKGWDIDVFWCAGGMSDVEMGNYSVALDRAQRLAKLATAGQKLSPSFTLGRIRLRALPELRQGGAYPAPGSGNTIRAEASKDEQEAAGALMSALNHVSPGFTLAGSNSPTPWYLSAFVCGAPKQTASAAAS